jgi:predicted 3-demethylubiquinone-9 3-methyltransferase (glyoxalase superfamily)
MTQSDVKHSMGGAKTRCGWLRDKFGVSWQIVPSVLGELLNDDDNQKSDRVMQAMLKMDKLDIKILKQAYAVDPAKLKPQIEIRDTYE